MTPYVLYADDDQDDQLSFTEVVTSLPIVLNPIVFHDGLYLVQYMESLAPQTPLPGCVVLDLNMPLWDGMKSLQTIRSMPRFKTLPIFIFSTSSAPRDRERSLQLGAHAFLTKPSRRSEYLHLASQLLACFA